MEELSRTLQKWTGRMEEVLTSRRRDHRKEKPLKRLLKRPSIKPGREHVSTVKETHTSTENAQSSGRKSSRRENKRSSTSSAIETERWQRQLHSWSKIKTRFNLSDDRYSDFSYLCYLDIDDPFVQNYFQYHAFGIFPLIKGRLRHCIDFWLTLKPPDWVLDIVRFGIKIPFENDPPRIFLPNNKTCLTNKIWVRETIQEFIEYGFIKKVDYIPKCVLPLQVNLSGSKLCLIHDEQALNYYVKKSKFKLEGWEEMFDYAKNSNYAIKFDLKKFYYEIDVHPDYQDYLGFMFPMKDGVHEFFVWTSMPFGYTRAPFIAKSLLKPLISKWRRLGINIVVFFDDGKAVSNDETELRKTSLQIQCDLIRSGLIPGVEKCIWSPCTKIEWLGLSFDYVKQQIYIKEKRICKLEDYLLFCLTEWPKVSFRNVSKLVGLIIAMMPVLCDFCLLHTRKLQTFVNIRNFHGYDWDCMIKCEFSPLFQFAKNEIIFWLENLRKVNFRNFHDCIPTVFGWVDASDFALGGVFFEFKKECNFFRPFTANGLLKRHIGLATIDESQHWDVRKMCQNLSKTEDLNVISRDFNVDLKNVVNYTFVHRQFNAMEQDMDSNERELLAARQLISGSVKLLKNKSVTLHFDNLNASIICKKGSTKYRLNKHALFIDKICRDYNIRLNTVWIPRDLNRFADKMSKLSDLEDYSVSCTFFSMIENMSGLKCTFDRFANNLNTKTIMFNSSSFCVGTAGVDAFNYDWGGKEINWIFPPPRLIVESVLHMKKCKAIGLLLVPYWQSSYFWPVITSEEYLQFEVNKWYFNGKNIFQSGCDVSSYFGPEFNAGVCVIHYEFS